VKRLFFLLCFQITLLVTAAEPTATPRRDADDPQTEANIAKSVARVLERFHYSQLKLDDELSEQFLERYLENLDGQHSHFLRSDAEEFESYRTKLDDLTLRAGDTSPAHKIFGRLLERVEQRVNFVTNLLSSERFTFDSDDNFLINRKDAPRPADLGEAKKLWQQQLRYEYLQEKLSFRHKNQKAAELGVKEEKKAPKGEKPLREGEWKPDPKAPALPGNETNNLDGARAADTATAKTKVLTAEEIHKEIVKKLSSRYARLEKSLKELSRDEVLEIYLTALAHVYDPHSDYMGRAQMENFAIQMKLSLFGIGAVLTTEDDFCKIQSLVAGAPAMRSKQIKEGDRIVAVAQSDKEPVDCVGMKLNKVVEMIRGPKGTEVRLTIMPIDAADPSVRKVVTLVRDEIKLEDQEAKAKVIDMPAEGGKTVRVGILDLPSFYEDMEGRGPGHKSTSADIAKLLKKLNEEKVAGIILDLRRNGGGALSEAIRLTGLFIKRGPVVQTKDSTGRTDVKADTDTGVLFDGPMIVLTSRFSASASEILAGALQDYGRALIVGDSSTHGKGTVQQLLQLQNILDDNKLPYAYNPGALKFTIQKFYRAGGASTQLKGVIPDIVLPSVNNYAEIGESSLENPLPWDEVTTEKFDKLNRVEPYLEALKKSSTKRLDNDKDFSYIRDDIERFKKTLVEKTVSLNEAKRISEMDELQAISETRKKERLARHLPDPKVYEVTLKNAEQPGLALAKSKTDSQADSPESTKTEDEDEKAPTIDPTLDEARRILSDYIALSNKDASVTLIK
jgi:carboxyl-terminal processing protease